VDPIILGIIASIVTIIAFVYMLLFGQRGLIDWLERRRRTASRSLAEPGAAITPTLCSPPLSMGAEEALSGNASAGATPPNFASEPLSAPPSVPTTPASPSPVSPSVEEEDVAESQKAFQEVIDQIAADVEDENCILFLGAGVSKETGLPMGDELAALLARRGHLELRPGEHLPELAQRFIGRWSRPHLENAIEEIIKSHRTKLTPALLVIAKLAEKLDTVITTNWDTLLEDAFKEAGARGCVCIYRDGDLPNREGTKTSIVKLHGHLPDKQSYAVTHDDILDFRRKNPLLIAELTRWLSSSTIVFLGFGLQDDDFQHTYVEVRDHLGSMRQRPVYVITLHRDRDREREWTGKGVRFVYRPASDFMLALYRCLREIANRKPELETAQQSLMPMPAFPIVEFCGIPGIGKTTLLKAISAEQSRTKPALKIAWVDFGDADLSEDGGPPSRRRILEKINRDLNVYAHTRDEWKAVLQNKQVLLIFDTLERATDSLLVWLGEVLLSLVQELPNLRAILACRQARLARVWGVPLKRYVHTERLGRFRRWDTRQQMELELFLNAELADEVYQLTAGHPGMVADLLDFFRQEGIDDPQSLHRPEHEAKLMSLLNDLAQRYILTHVGHLTEKMRLVAHFRAFGPVELRLVLPDFLPAFVGEEEITFMDLITDELVPTSLVWYDSKEAAYVMDEAVRGLFLSHFRLLDADAYAAVSDKLVKLYDDWAWVKGAESRRAFYLGEKLYHLAKQEQAKTKPSPEALQSRLGGSLKDDLARGGSPSLRDQLYDILMHHSALEDIVPIAIYKVLLQVAKPATALGEAE